MTGGEVTALGLEDGMSLGKEDPDGVELGSFEGCVEDDGKSDGAPLGKEDPLGESLGIDEGSC